MVSSLILFTFLLVPILFCSSVLSNQAVTTGSVNCSFNLVLDKCANSKGDCLRSRCIYYDLTVPKGCPPPGCEPNQVETLCMPEECDEMIQSVTGPNKKTTQSVTTVNTRPNKRTTDSVTGANSKTKKMTESVTAANTRQDKETTQSVTAANTRLDKETTQSVTAANTRPDKETTQTVIAANTRPDKETTQSVIAANTRPDKETTQSVIAANSRTMETTQRVIGANTRPDKETTQSVTVANSRTMETTQRVRVFKNRRMRKTTQNVPVIRAEQAEVSGSPNVPLVKTTKYYTERTPFHKTQWFIILMILLALFILLIILFIIFYCPMKRTLLKAEPSDTPLIIIGTIDRTTKIHLHLSDAAVSANQRRHSISSSDSGQSLVGSVLNRDKTDDQSLTAETSSQQSVTEKKNY